MKTKKRIANQYDNQLLLRITTLNKNVPLKKRYIVIGPENNRRKIDLKKYIIR